ncbi:hypothetical protein LTR60_005115, partial [Cryomyces antarcticus]
GVSRTRRRGQLPCQPGGERREGAAEGDGGAGEDQGEGGQGCRDGAGETGSGCFERECGGM